MTIKKLDNTRLQAVLELQHRVLEAIPHPDLFAYSDGDLVREMLGGKGFILGAFADGELVGVSSVYYPGDQEYNLGRHLPLPAGEIASVAHMEFSCILPSQTRKSLARTMYRQAVKMIPDFYRHLAATASPDNYVSLHILLGEGLRIRALDTLYDGKLRFVLHQDRLHPIQENADAARVIDGRDVPAQRDLLHKGWAGVSVKPPATSFGVVYSPFAT